MRLCPESTQTYIPFSSHLLTTCALGEEGSLWVKQNAEYCRYMIFVLKNTVISERIRAYSSARALLA